MSILLNLNVKKKVEKVPIFVLNSLSLDSMQFYGFHPKLRPVFDGDFRPSSHANVQAVPFTAVDSLTQFCSFVSFRDDMLVVGGALLPLRLIHRLNIELSKRLLQSLRIRGEELIGFDEIVKIINEECPLEKLLSLRQRDLTHITSLASDRVLGFQVQKFVENEQKPRVELSDLDSDIKHPYWRCKLSVVDRFLYSIGGVDRLDFSLEVFMGVIWRVNIGV